MTTVDVTVMTDGRCSSSAVIRRDNELEAKVAALAAVAEMLGSDIKSMLGPDPK